MQIFIFIIAYLMLEKPKNIPTTEKRARKSKRKLLESTCINNKENLYKVKILR